MDVSRDPTTEAELARLLSMTDAELARWNAERTRAAALANGNLAALSAARTDLARNPPDIYSAGLAKLRALNAQSAKQTTAETVATPGSPPIYTAALARLRAANGGAQ